ncbi:hypothetical protein HOR54_gp18 [Vibrio phage Vp670]|uniref:Uncharacterized protein n=1 Tax=Vibrio phage Vp670 TaxID=1932890 RepID=A0A1L7DQ14_9CAUD|nr:hypothetical protein HOR54_gp18 [Vibrio phage Vp670]APU00155.1 hypothetical protein QD07_18 [Vibrio phage Vp670]
MQLIKLEKCKAVTGLPVSGLIHIAVKHKLLHFIGFMINPHN